MYRGDWRLRPGFVKTHSVCVLSVSFTLVLLLIVFDWLCFIYGFTAACYGLVYAIAGTETLIRPDAFSVPAVHGVWEEWSPWSLCSFTCGRGHRTRTRMCAPPQHGGRACDGPETQTKLCNIALCPGIICLLSKCIKNNNINNYPWRHDDEREVKAIYLTRFHIVITQQLLQRWVKNWMNVGSVVHFK